MPNRDFGGLERWRPDGEHQPQGDGNPMDRVIAHIEQMMGLPLGKGPNDSMPAIPSTQTTMK